MRLLSGRELIDTMTFTMEETFVSNPSQQTNSNTNMLPITIGAVVIVFLGVGTGFLLNQTKGGSNTLGKKEIAQEASGEIKVGEVYGSTDEKAFRDSTEGVLEKGGLNGEGSHKLIRPGGESQTAYLTSSTLNLDQFAGRKVKVWGETYKAEKAGWFMDVGRLEVLE